MTQTHLPKCLVNLVCKILVIVLFCEHSSWSSSISFDGRSLIIDGERVLLLSGGMHYARATPSAWNHTMQLAKQMNLNTIQTYFMWNIHEPLTKGDLVWSGLANITQFLDIAASHGLYVNLRIGPYVCGEWNYGGFPWWTRDIPGIEFRTYNPAFMTEMQRIMSILVEKVEPYLITNGGPVILMQVENEYTNHPNATFGEEYVKWAVNMSESLTHNTFPWIMCEHNPTMNTWAAIQTINGFWDEHNVDKTSWPSPGWIAQHVKSYPDQPLFWTEDQAWFQGWGGGTLIRLTNEIANGILRWYALGGSYHNFYMLYGGNNFARHAGKNVITAYANDAPINPYGMPNNPKYEHLSAVFAVLADYAQCILGQKPPDAVPVQTHVEAITYQNASTAITFLSNIGPVLLMNVKYASNTYALAANSTVVLVGSASTQQTLVLNSTGPALNTEVYPDCILPAHNASQVIDISSNWLYWSESVGVGGQMNTTYNQYPIEMWHITCDETEYIWYTPLTFNISLPKNGSNTVDTYKLHFVNSQQPQYVYVYQFGEDGDANSHLLAQGFVQSTFKWTSADVIVDGDGDGDGANNAAMDGFFRIAVLFAALGMNNGGYDQPTQTKGITGQVTFQINSEAVQSIQNIGWQSEGKLYGEYMQLYEKDSFDKVHWQSTVAAAVHQPLIWWRSTFVTPAFVRDGMHFVSLAIDMSGATKGFIYVNGYNLGRYWMIASNCAGSPHSHSDITMQWDALYCEQKLPLQRYYTLPVDWLNFGGGANGNVNDIVLIEEIGMIAPTNINIVVCQ